MESQGPTVRKTLTVATRTLLHPVERSQRSFLLRLQHVSVRILHRCRLQNCEKLISWLELVSKRESVSESYTFWILAGFRLFFHSPSC